MVAPADLQAHDSQLNSPCAAMVGFIVLLIATLAVYRSPYCASNLEVVPDSVEAAVGAQRFAALGTFDLEIDGRRFPSRYSPWFSTIVLSPFYRFFPNEVGVGIVPVFVLALVTVLLTFVIANHFAGVWAGGIASVVLLRCSVFRIYAGEITTDIPTLALLLIAGWIYVRSCPMRLRDWLIAGAAIAAAGALRPTSFAAVLPFIFRICRMRPEKRAIARVVLLVAPVIAVFVATAAYQTHTFGDWRRTGYQFWCAVPYDFPSLTFSPRYLGNNLSSFSSLWLPFMVGLIGALLILFRGEGRARSLFAFALFTGGPITAFHLFYFFPSPRFFFPLVIFACIFGGIGLARILPSFIKHSRWVLPVALLPLATMYFDRPGTEAPLRWVLAHHIAEQTPGNAIIITDLDPVFLEPLVVRTSHRRIVPISRQVEYASKLVAPHRVVSSVAPPPDPFNHRWEMLKSFGAREAVAATADEIADQLADQAARGEPVFFAFDLSNPPAPEVVTVCEAFGRRHLPAPRMIR